MMLAMLLAALPALAQDNELNRLTSIVTSLKGGGEKAYGKAVESLSADRSWVMMDELGRDREAECRVADKVAGFRLNSVLTNAEQAQRLQVSTGNHLNGADTRYSYSLYEKTLKAGKTASYTLNGRWGRQTFLFIPFQGGKAALSPSITCGGKAFREERLGDGIVRLTGVADKGEPLMMKVANGGKAPVSYVVINYNSRDL